MNHSPNIILIMTDQQRADLSKREGFELDTTPFLDSLAQQGRWFNHAYTPMPACAPARTSMLTGRYPNAHGIRENYELYRAVFEQDVFSIMKEQGYRTALIGKNHTYLTAERVDYFANYDHLGSRRKPNSAQEEEFDSWLKTLGFHISLEPSPFPLECQLPYRMVSDAQDWIKDNSDQPFCMWLSFPEPHNPYQVPEPYYSLFQPADLPPLDTNEQDFMNRGFKWQYTHRIGEMGFPDYQASIPRARANYLGMLRLLDDQLKRFVTFLEVEGLRENTLVVFMADHGDFVGEYGMLRKGPEMPEVLMRIPFFAVGPGVEANPLPHPAFVSLVDLLPTLCEFTGVGLPKGVQGKSFWPLLSGQDYPPGEFASVYGEQGVGGLHYTEDDVTEVQPGLPTSKTGAFDCLNSCSQSGLLRMVRKGEWKLVLDMQGRGQFFNLADDPFELNNLWGKADYIREQTELLTELAVKMMQAVDPLPIPASGYTRKVNPRNYWVE
ncbi:MAG: sulfatase-like hydrolase/transferase [Chloroflexi bacterium]|nr:sulfatase-like hydrolase/transferase [Chloroflexota bacterium]